MTAIDKERDLLERDVADLRERIAAIEDQDAMVQSSADGTRIVDVDPKDSLPDWERRLAAAEDKLRRHVSKSPTRKELSGFSRL